jgi:hypothetical protein
MEVLNAVLCLEMRSKERGSDRRGGVTGDVVTGEGGVTGDG